MVAARETHEGIEQALGRRLIQTFARALNERADRSRPFVRLGGRFFRSKHHDSASADSGAMGKNSPLEATPNMRLPSISRISPISTSSRKTARVTRAHRPWRTC